MTKVNVDRWGEHVAALQASGKTVAQYAAEHGLSRHTLYAARRQVAAAERATARQRRPAARAVAKAGPFVAVRVVSRAVALRACLPNGVALEFAPMEAEACAKLIGMLATLPCSN